MRTGWLAVGLGVLLAAGASTWGVAGEAGAKKRPKRQKREKAQPVSTADYIKAIQELLAVANELEAPGAEAKGKELRDRIATACKSLRISGRQAERLAAIDDNKALAARLRGYAGASLRGKVTYERRKLIQGKPELTDAYKKIQDKEKAVAQEKEDFYKTLRPLSPDLDELEKVREALAAEQERKRQEAAEARRKAMEERKRKADEARKKRAGQGKRKKKTQ